MGFRVTPPRRAIFFPPCLKPGSAYGKEGKSVMPVKRWLCAGWPSRRASQRAAWRVGASSKLNNMERIGPNSHQGTVRREAMCHLATTPLPPDGKYQNGRAP